MLTAVMISDYDVYVEAVRCPLHLTVPANKLTDATTTVHAQAGGKGWLRSNNLKSMKGCDSCLLPAVRWTVTIL